MIGAVTLIALATMVFAGSALSKSTVPKTTYVYNKYASTVKVYSTRGPCADWPRPWTCKVVARLANYTTVKMYCWADIYPSYSGNYVSQRWFVIKWSGKVGWVHSSYVEKQTKVKNCHDVPPPSNDASDADAGTFAPSVSTVNRTLQSATQPAKTAGWAWSWLVNQNGGKIPIQYFPRTGNWGTVKTWVDNNTKAKMVCWTDADWYTGNLRSNRWFWVKWYTPHEWISGTGYVHSSYVYYQKKVKHC